jgi:hypothetical protein
VPAHIARNAVAVPSFALAFALVMNSACQVGESDPPIGGDGSVPGADASGGGADGGGTGDCIPIEQNVTIDGVHKARYDYLQGSAGCLGNTCHNGQRGPVLTVAGAIYDQLASGGSPIAGRHIVVTDTNGRSVTMMSAPNGFFWTKEPLTPPYRTYATGCPDRIEMVALTTNGNCNGGGACHIESNKIYLPAGP